MHLKTRIVARFERNPVVYGTGGKAIYLSCKGKRGDARCRFISGYPCVHDTQLQLLVKQDGIEAVAGKRRQKWL